MALLHRESGEVMKFTWGTSMDSSDVTLKTNLKSYWGSVTIKVLKIRFTFIMQIKFFFPFKMVPSVRLFVQYVRFYPGRWRRFTFYSQPAARNLSVFCSGSRERPQYWSQYDPIPENPRNRPACHHVICHKFILKNGWAWVKKSII